MNIEMPPDWDSKQLITDMFATLRDAAERELDRLPSFLNLSGDTRSRLYRLWTHLHAAGFLMVSFAIVEGTLGPRAWTRYPSLPQDEFEVLACIRNSVVHEGGDLSKVRDLKCVDNVRIFASKMSSELCWSRFPTSDTTWAIGEAMMMESYYSVDGTQVTLLSAAFERIYNLMFALLDEAT